jgi:hypothetical protein
LSKKKKTKQKKIFEQKTFLVLGFFEMLLFLINFSNIEFIAIFSQLFVLTDIYSNIHPNFPIPDTTYSFLHRQNGYYFYSWKKMCKYLFVCFSSSFSPFFHSQALLFNPSTHIMMYIYPYIRRCFELLIGMLLSLPSITTKMKAFYFLTIIYLRSSQRPNRPQHNHHHYHHNHHHHTHTYTNRIYPCNALPKKRQFPLPINQTKS